MADIQDKLDAIRAAVNGEEVRGTIADALEAMNEQAAAAQEWATGQDDPTAEPGPTNNAEYWAEQAAAQAEAAADLAGYMGEYFANVLLVLKSSEVRTGYYKWDGVYDTWTKTLCTRGYLGIPQDRNVFLVVTAKDGRYVKITEYDENDTYVHTYGEINPNATNPTTNHLEVFVAAGHKVKMSMGFWSGSNASSYNTNAYLAANFVIKYGTAEYGTSELAELHPTEDETDRKTEIETLLNTYGVCYLGKGTYYTSEIAMPDEASIIGQGQSTKIVLIDHSPDNPPVGNQWIYGDQSFTNYGDVLFDEPLPPGRYKFTADIVTESSVTNLILYAYKEHATTAAAVGVKTNINKNTGRVTFDMPYYFYGMMLGAAGSITGITDRATYSNITLEFVSGITESCIRLGSNCTLRDFSIDGQSQTVFHDVAEDPGYGSRHGILFQRKDSSNTVYRGYLSGLRIMNFDAGGITLNDTGGSTSGGLRIVNCNIANCYVGMNIPHVSEYHKITNCEFTLCYVGCVCNGGNNSLVNCGFDSNQIGFKVDTDSGTHTNSTHGQMVGATIQHSVLRAIEMRDSASGWIFSACNTDSNGPIVLERMWRVVFTGINFMDPYSIKITNCHGILFNACMFRGTIEQSGAVDITGGNTFFEACYAVANSYIHKFDPTAA